MKKYHNISVRAGNKIQIQIREARSGVKDNVKTRCRVPVKGKQTTSVDARTERLRKRRGRRYGDLDVGRRRRRRRRARSGDSNRRVGSGRVARGSDSRGKILDASSRGARCARAARAVAAAMIGFYDFCCRDSFIASERRVDGSATAMPTRWIPMVDSSKKRELAASWCQECQE